MSLAQIGNPVTKTFTSSQNFKPAQLPPSTNVDTKSTLLNIERRPDTPEILVSQQCSIGLIRQVSASFKEDPVSANIALLKFALITLKDGNLEKVSDLLHLAVTYNDQISSDKFHSPN